MANYLNNIFLNSASSSYTDLSTGRANWVMNPPINFPARAKLKVCLHSFSFTNFFVNISAVKSNNKFYYTDDIALPEKYSITIPDGSYSVSDLSEAINIAVINNGHTDNLIVLTPDFASNRVVFTISTVGWQIYMKGLDTPYVLLGCNANQTIPAGALTTVANYSELAPKVAAFNDLLNIYVHTNLSNNSIFGGVQSNIIANVIPTSSIGSVQNSEPTNLMFIDASELAGSSLNNISVYLTNQVNEPISLSDHFSLTLLVAQV
jgi:hypothetical protein